jgi:DNA-binding NarL/FixJ family response regulator
LGFPKVEVVNLERDALYNFIDDMKPDRVMMGARFFYCCTPFMMGELRKAFPDIPMAALVIGEYPPDLAMYFILNGVNSYVTSFMGVEQFYKGIDEISKGREYVSPGVMERKYMRFPDLKPAGKITKRHMEVIRLTCCGFWDKEIGEILHISRNTVTNHKTDIFTSLNVRSSIELVIAALTQKIVGLDELCFRPYDLILNPLPENKLIGRRNDDYQN